MNTEQLKQGISRANYMDFHGIRYIRLDELLDIIDIVAETQIAGVIATNTTISREGLHSENQSFTKLPNDLI